MVKFNADEIASVIQREIASYEDRVDVREVGTVLEVGDGIARVYGLTNVMAGEMVQFPSGVNGLAFNLEENSVGVIILGDYLEINEGDEVKSLGRLLSVPVGESVVGPSSGSAGKSPGRTRSGQCHGVPSGGNSRGRGRGTSTGEGAATNRPEGG